MKYIHITCVAIGVFVPVVPVVVMILYYVYGTPSAGQEAVKGDLGFGITRFPPLLCTGRQGNIIFYLIAVPSIVMVMTGIAILASLLWMIHKVRS